MWRSLQQEENFGGVNSSENSHQPSIYGDSTRRFSQILMLLIQIFKCCRFWFPLNVQCLCANDKLV
jgi:hypothetical protein